MHVSGLVDSTAWLECLSTSLRPSTPPNSRRIIPTRMKGMAAADAPHALPSSHERPVLADRSDEVVAARRLEPALSTKDRTQEDLVQSHAADQKPRQQGLQPSQAGDRSTSNHNLLPSSGRERGQLVLPRLGHQGWPFD